MDDERMESRFWGITITPITRRRLHNFRANRRGFWSLWIFLALFLTSLFAELIANDRPLLINFDSAYYMPFLNAYPETMFGGDFPTEADYRDEFVADLIEAKGWMLWPIIRYDFSTINYDLPSPAPSPPTAENWLGTDDQGRDVVARMIYGFRISVLFGLVLTWLLLHRFRVGWLEREDVQHGVAAAIAERRAAIDEGDVDAAVGEGT